MTSHPARPPVLDVDLLDAAAEVALGDVRLDLGAVRARAGAASGARRRRYVVLAAAAAVVALLAGVALSGLGVLRSAPQPAQVPSGPGALPERVYPAPTVLPSVSDAPIGRVAVVLLDVLRLPVWSDATTSTEPVLVGAYGGQYRRLPDGRAGLVSLSADGRVVAWAHRLHEGVTEAFEGVVRWVDVSTGRVRSAGFDYPVGQVPVVESTALSPDGRVLLVGVSSLMEAGGSARSLDAWTVDTTSGQATPFCRGCTVTAAWDASGRLLVEPREGVPAQRLPGQGALVTTVGVGSTSPQSVATPPVLVSEDGRRRLVMTKGRLTDAGVLDDFRLVELSDRPSKGAGQPDGAPAVQRTVNLGRAVEGGVLGWSGDRALVVLSGEDYRQTVSDVSLTSGDRRPALAGTAAREGYPQVQLVAADVFAGGLTLTTPRPASPWLSAEGARVVGATAWRWSRWLVVPVVVGLLLWLPPRIRRRRREVVVPAGPSQLDRTADGDAGRDAEGDR